MTITKEDLERFEELMEKARHATGTYGDEWDGFVLGFALAFIQAKGLGHEFIDHYNSMPSQEVGKP